MAWITVPVLVFFALFTGIFAQCPPPSLILPCNCSETVFPLVECGKIFDMGVLVNVFDKSVDRKFYNFALYESSIMYLPAVSLSSKQFQILMMVNSTFTALFDANPSTDNQIEMIILMKVRFQRGIGWELFKTLKKLKYFKSENTEIKSLGKKFVENMNPGLQNLILLDAKVKKIYPNAFQKLVKLWDLEITNSFVKELKRSMFATPSALETIDFSGNQIQTLPDDLFSDMPQLKEVILNNNKISAVSEAVFGNVYERIGSISLNDNPLKCDCTVRWFVIKSRRIAYGQCDSPGDKKGQKIQDLKETDFIYCT